MPIERSSLEDSSLDWEYRKMSARYRARHQHSFVVASECIDAIHEALLIWDDCAQELKDLADQLSEKERQILVEALRYIDNLHPSTEAETRVNKDILYARADRDVKDPFANDPFATEYNDIVGRIQVLLRPKLHLE